MTSKLIQARTGKIDPVVDQMASGGFEFDITSRWKSWYRGRYLGKYNEARLEPNTDTYQIMTNGGYTTHDLGFVYAHSKQKKIKIEVSNLFDKSYRYPYGTQTTWREPLFPRGRRILGRYEVEF